VPVSWVSCLQRVLAGLCVGSRAAAVQGKAGHGHEGQRIDRASELHWRVAVQITLRKGAGDNASGTRMTQVELG
jgi:hypothetical protein